jgi:hypothetical protein
MPSRDYGDLSRLAVEAELDVSSALVTCWLWRSSAAGCR